MLKSLSVRLKTTSLGHNAPIYTLFFDAEINTLYSGAGEGWVVEWKPPTFEIGSLIIQIEGSIFSIHKLPHLPIMLVGTLQGGVYWIDMLTKTILKSSQHHLKSVFAIHSHKNIVYTLGGEGKITAWNTATYFPIESNYLSPAALRSIDFHPTLPQAAIGASDSHIYILNTESFAIEQTILNAHHPSVFSVKYSPNGDYLWSGGRDALLKQWAVKEQYSWMNSVKAHLFTINEIAISPNGKLLATASRDKTIKIWDGESLALLKVMDAFKFSLHRNSVNTLLWTNEALISGSDDRTIAHWEVE